MTAVMVPSPLAANWALMAAVSASADCSGPRTDQSLKVGNASAALSPWPEKLKPLTMTALATDSRDMMNFSSASAV